jgi:hypothetical protein
VSDHEANGIGSPGPDAFAATLRSVLNADA